MTVNDDDHPLVAHVSERVDTHLPHAKALGDFSWKQDAQGNLRCPADDEIVVPSPEWLGW